MNMKQFHWTIAEGCYMVLKPLIVKHFLALKQVRKLSLF